MILSIAIPTFNRAEHLENLLAALEKQQANQALFEVVISDNCSTDRTPELIKSYQQRLPNLRYSRNDENIGADRNIYKCHSLGKYKFVWVMGDDEVFYREDALQQLIDELKQVDESVNLIFMKQVVLFLETGKTMQAYNNEVLSDIYFKDGKDILQIQKVACEMGGISSCIFRNGVLSGGFVERYGAKKYVGPLALALYAASTGSALYLNKNFIHAGVGVKQNWNKYWSFIFFLDETDMLHKAVKELGYSESKYRRIIHNMKSPEYRIHMDYISLLTARRRLNWFALAGMYGTGFLLGNLLVAPFMILKNLRIVRAIKK